MNSTLLAGLRVVEASAFVAAPLGGMTLAQLGADVIRIDPPGGGLDFHRWPLTRDGVSLFWCGLNKAKRSVTIDTTKPEGRELAIALVCADGADGGILLSNLPPTGWRDHEALRRRRADLIQLTLQGTHQGGPAVDYTVNCAVGVPAITGPESSDEIVNHVLPAWDVITGQMIAVGLLAAERHRRITGQGQHVKLALEDVALATMGNLGFLAEAELGEERGRHGNWIFGSFGRDFVCQDGRRVMLVAVTAKQWRALVAAMGAEAEMAELSRGGGAGNVDLDDEGARFTHRFAIATVVERWLGTQYFAEARRIFDEHGVCWGPYRSVREAVTSADGISAHPLFAGTEQPGVGALTTAGHPLHLPAAATRPPVTAPRLGQHTEEVLESILKLGSAQLGALQERGVIALS